MYNVVIMGRPVDGQRPQLRGPFEPLLGAFAGGRIGMLNVLLIFYDWSNGTPRLSKAFKKHLLDGHSLSGNFHLLCSWNTVLAVLQNSAKPQSFPRLSKTILLA